MIYVYVIEKIKYLYEHVFVWINKYSNRQRILKSDSEYFKAEKSDTLRFRHYENYDNDRNHYNNYYNNVIDNTYLPFYNSIEQLYYSSSIFSIISIEFKIVIWRYKCSVCLRMHQFLCARRHFATDTSQTFHLEFTIIHWI